MQTRHGRVTVPAEKKHYDDDGGFGRVPAFLLKTYELVGDGVNSDVVSWEDDGQSFVIWQPAEFSRDLLPQYFKHSNLASFVRQLNTYGFQKASPDRWEFHHPNFKRTRPELLTNIPRRRTTNKPGRSYGEVSENKALLDQVEHLKKDKHSIMSELLRLQQSQQRCERETAGLSARLHQTEQVQKRLMALLTAAVQDPSILRQVLAATNERLPLEGRISTGTKRQRPWAEEDDEEDEAAAPTEQQIVPRASAGTAWPQLFATEPEVRVVHETGDLPAEAAKTAAAGDSKDFSFIPTSHGVAKAVSPFELSQKEGEQESVHEAQAGSVGEAPVKGGAHPTGSPLSLRSTDLIVAPKAAGMDDGMLPMPSMNLPGDWSWRGFDILGSQPSWTFAVGQGMEAVH